MRPGDETESRIGFLAEKWVVGRRCRVWIDQRRVGRGTVGVEGNSADGCHDISGRFRLEGLRGCYRVVVDGRGGGETRDGGAVEV